MNIHPIVCYLKEKRGLVGPDFAEVVDKDNPLEMLLLKIFTIKYNNSVESAALLSDIDSVILLGHQDHQVYVRALSVIIGWLSHINSQTQEHHFIQKILSMFSLLESNYNVEADPEFFVYFKQSEAYIQYLKGNVAENNRILREAIQSTDMNSVEYMALFSNFCGSLAAQGMLESITSEQKQYLFNQANKAPTLLLHYLTNAIYTFQLTEGLSVIDNYEKQLSEIDDSRATLAKNYLIYLNNLYFMQNEKCEVDVFYAKIIECLLQKRVQEAEEFYKQAIKDDNFLKQKSELRQYLDLRIEFIRKDKGKIRLLLKEREKRVQYLDDFFYGRLYLLENNRAKANECFELLMVNVTKYKAMNRLIFELRLAPELEISIGLRLAQGWPKSYYSDIIDVEKIEPAIEKITNNAELLVGTSEAIKNIRIQIKQFANIDSSILVLGETGTGKELVASAIHQEGPYHKEPFLAINCGALTDSLLQSELFGYVAGAFTGAQKERKGIFEAAGKGTVFLDEFGEISPKMQVSLLRVLESNEIRMIGATSSKKIACKIIIATNIDLEKAVAEKQFREDLYFRLKRFEIDLPALRERKEDIPILIQNFLDKNAKDFTGRKQLSVDLLKELIAYDWPGNIRELKNEIDRLYILNPDYSVIPLECFDFSRLKIKPKHQPAPKPMSEARERHSSFEVQSNPLQGYEEEKKILEMVGFRSEYRLNQIRELFERHSKLSRNQIVAITNASPATITKDLKTLCDEGFIQRVMPTSSRRTHYFVKS